MSQFCKECYYRKMELNKVLNCNLPKCTHKKRKHGNTQTFACEHFVHKDSQLSLEALM